MPNAAPCRRDASQTRICHASLPTGGGASSARDVLQPTASKAAVGADRVPQPWVFPSVVGIGGRHLMTFEYLDMFCCFFSVTLDSGVTLEIRLDSQTGYFVFPCRYVYLVRMGLLQQSSACFLLRAMFAITRLLARCPSRSLSFSRFT